MKNEKLNRIGNFYADIILKKRTEPQLKTCQNPTGCEIPPKTGRQINKRQSGGIRAGVKGAFDLQAIYEGF